MKVSELAERTGLALRQIRYLISEELVPHAGGSRTSPVYDERHVAAIERYKELSEAGYRPAKIRALLAGRGARRPRRSDPPCRKAST